jgi:hypothetical protein
MSAPFIPPSELARATRDRAQHIIAIACILIAAFSASYFAVRMLGAVL